jgi:hypothetical protein
MRIVIEPANAEDDPDLRRLARENPMSGPISIAFLREPSFFTGAAIQGQSVQVNVARDTVTGRAVGVGTRALRRAFVNGQPQLVGYLSDLRLAESYRGGTVIARAYRYLRALHEDGQVKLYFTVIVEGNRTAELTIASGRAGLPNYHPMGRLVTHAVLPVRRKPAPAGVRVERGSAALWPAIVEQLNRAGATRQFGTHWSVDDLAPGSRLAGLSPEDFHVVVRDGRVIATGAAWDQRGCKQTLVVGYTGWLDLVRPLANRVWSAFGGTPYPAPGEEMRSFHAAFLTAENDEPELASAVLHSIQESARGQGYAYFLAGLHERDPLCPAIAGFWTTPFRARVYAVTFPEDDAAWSALDGRVPHVEAALL